MTRDSDNADDGAHSLREKLQSPPVQLAIVLAVVGIGVVVAALTATVVFAQDPVSNDTIAEFEGDGKPGWVDFGGTDYSWDDPNAARYNESAQSDGGSFSAFAVFNTTAPPEQATVYINRLNKTGTTDSFIQFRESNAAEDGGPRISALNITNDDSLTINGANGAAPQTITNIIVPDDEWVQIHLNNINYTDDTYDLSIYAANGTEVGNLTDVTFSDTTASTIDSVTINQPAGSRVDYMAVGVSADPIASEQPTSPTDTNEDLRLNVPKHLEHNESGYYEVEYNDDGTWVDVTNDSNTSITLSNPNAATFYSSNHTVVASGNTSINEAVTVTADYGTLTDQEDMVVAGTTIENLAILPDPWIKTEASVGDGMMLWLIGAALVAIVGARAAGPTAGVGAYVMVMAAGWISTPVSNGVMIVAMTAAIFLGLNVALNVDTSVRQ